MSERALARLRRDAVGFVFQAFHLMDELTAAENVELPALLAGRSPRAARRRAARGEIPASSAGSSTFSTAVSSSIRWKAWKTNPTASRRNRARVFSLIRSRRRPASWTSPEVGRSRPPISCSRVDFPQPLGPITATVSPPATSTSTWSTARTSPWSLP